MIRNQLLVVRHNLRWQLQQQPPNKSVHSFRYALFRKKKPLFHDFTTSSTVDDSDHNDPTNNNHHHHHDDENCDDADYPSDITKMNQTMEKWFASIIKPSSFYAQHGDIRNNMTSTGTAATTTTATTNTMTPAQQILASEGHNNKQRCYFYNIDLHGRLYLEEYPVKNIISSINDVKFLDYFFAHIKYTNEVHKEYMIQHNIPIHDYPYVSICQKEWNFIRPAATPIVFHSLVQQEQYLLYGSSNAAILREPFDEANGIAVSKRTGKLYHKLTTHSYYPLSMMRKRYPSLAQQQQYALIRSTVVLSLSDRIVDLQEYSNNDGPNERQPLTAQQQPQQVQPERITAFSPSTQADVIATAAATDTVRQQFLLVKPQSPSSGLGFVTKYNRVVPIMYLPSYAEPGPYAMSSF